MRNEPDPVHDPGLPEMRVRETMFAPYLHRWKLVPDGDPIMTPTSCLLPVLQDGSPMMLKIARTGEERRGGALMAWWGGEGAARVYAYDGTAFLLERATGTGSLTLMSRSGQDAEACRILCGAASRLHVPRHEPPPDLVPLAHWFEGLEPAAHAQGGILEHSLEAARFLFASPEQAVVLHGDLHHGNVLDFEDRGWLAIDPKGLWGEREFDFANIFLNPDLVDPDCAVAVDQHRFTQRLMTISTCAALDRRRLLLWILAWCGLSAAWLHEDGKSASVSFRIAELAAAELNR